MTDLVEGGQVPRGAALIIAHAGEYVVTPEQMKRLLDEPPTQT